MLSLPFLSASDVLMKRAAREPAEETFAHCGKVGVVCSARAVCASALVNAPISAGFLAQVWCRASCCELLLDSVCWPQGEQNNVVPKWKKLLANPYLLWFTDLSILPLPRILWMHSILQTTKCKLRLNPQNRKHPCRVTHTHNQICCHDNIFRVCYCQLFYSALFSWF